ncbi:MAG: iron-containing alcohol dehydrogenase, partial [Elusimicrobiales bacterium]|nr:iron-containing alcohol dehydrogenase [Elusimicrobiales bacterium]
GCVITNEKTQQKYSAHSKHLFPKVSILDPTTTLSLPIEQTAYGCVDAMLHVLEGYFTTKDTDSIITDNYVYAITNSLIESTRRILKNPNDLNARSSMMWACSLALNGMEDLGYSNTEFVNHVIEHSLSAIYDIPHGLGLSIIFCGFLKKLHFEKKFNRIALFGRKIFSLQGEREEIVSNKTIEKIEEFFRIELNLKTRLSENSIYSRDFDKIVKNACELGNLWGWSYKEKDVFEVLEFSK